jgi:hypothetical protein
MRSKIQPQEEETKRHHDTRVASWGTPAAIYNTHRKYKRFSEKIFHNFEPHASNWWVAGNRHARLRLSYLSYLINLKFFTHASGSLTLFSNSPTYYFIYFLHFVESPADTAVVRK